MEITQLGKVRIEHKTFEFRPVGCEERESYSVVSVNLAQLAPGSSPMTEVAAPTGGEAGVFCEIPMCLDTCFNNRVSQG